MRHIDDIILHCTATPAGRHVTVSDIDRWHRQRGWASIGYHFVIYLDGTVHRGRPVAQIGAHCSGHNAGSIGICYVGGLSSDGLTPTDTRTPAQCAALHRLVHELLQSYPHATVHGHNDYAPKACPCFKVGAEAW